MFDDRIVFTLRESKRAKRVRLAVYCDGSVVVTTPLNVKHSIIKDLVVEKRYWIYEKLRYYRSLDTKAIRVFSNEDYLKNKEKAKKFVVARVDHFNKIYNFSYNKINIKNQKTRWGSCSKKRNLNFNYKIIFLPEKIRDYLIVHEICHLLEFNHSEKFWRLVQKACPDYKEYQRRLREFDLYYK